MQETKRDGFMRLMYLLMNELPSDSDMDNYSLSAVRRNAEAELTCCDQIVAKATEMFGLQNEG